MQIRQVSPANPETQRLILELKIETRIYQNSALKCYENMGYEKCGPFGDYKVTEYNLYFQKEIKEI